MVFEFSCFLSYRNLPSRLNQRFIDQIIDALEAYVPVYLNLPIFPGRSRAGARFKVSIEHALCTSVCMIPVYTPTYFDPKESFCVREYHAMELIEKRRLDGVQSQELKNQGLIIPIIFKGKAPGYIADKRDCAYDFSHFLLCSSDIAEHPDYNEWFDQIGSTIRAIYDCFKKEPQGMTALNGNGIKLPTENEVKPVLEKIDAVTKPSFPLRRRMVLPVDRDHGR